ncbi:MAG: tRNA (adenosine(37)-N6)-dimethylallyltransferase MiaA [Betaproteobacteria bacterium]|nr:tRNA (adenosine(37)-N6)-dimethylallyltransferase MiaA [Betaproteobacteria bacterium]
MPAHAEAPVRVLTGPTASGKTAAALLLARELDLEIISMDSALVYRGMDIGTAKPSPAELAQVPHHLIDIVEPTQNFSAAQFAQHARALIAEVRARGREPLVVGGTLLYLRALEQGLSELPGADPALRARLEARAALHGWGALHAELARVDPESAARIEPGDTQRIQRALEVWELSGRPLSRHFQAAPREPRLELRVVSLEPSDRAWLHARIAERLGGMLREGLLDEVRALRARGDLHPGLASMRCVGYRQAWEHLDGLYDAAQFEARAVAATRQLAKRQLTWLRSMPGRQRIDCCATDATEQAVGALLRADAR